MTTQEDKFSHFEIERSVDGINFIKIGSKTGKGTSNNETNYMFDDNEIRAVQYYRLKQVDIDGRFTYSNVLRVNRDDVNNAKVLFSNRVTSSLSLRIIDMETNSLSIRIIDNAGRLIKSQDVKINQGENSFQLNTSTIPSGFYHLMLTGENYKRTFSFVKS